MVAELGDSLAEKWYPSRLRGLVPRAPVVPHIRSGELLQMLSATEAWAPRSSRTTTLWSAVRRRWERDELASGSVSCVLGPLLRPFSARGAKRRWCRQIVHAVRTALFMPFIIRGNFGAHVHVLEGWHAPSASQLEGRIRPSCGGSTILGWARGVACVLLDVARAGSSDIDCDCTDEFRDPV